METILVWLSQITTEAVPYSDVTSAYQEADGDHIYLHPNLSLLDQNLCQPGLGFRDSIQAHQPLVGVAPTALNAAVYRLPVWALPTIPEVKALFFIPLFRQTTTSFTVPF